MYTFDNRGNLLGELPLDAVKFNSPGAPQSSLIMLSGKYVDRDGIVYDANGNVDEPATAAWARDAVTQRVSQYDPTSVKQESIQENSNADMTRSAVDNFLSNIYYTATESVPEAAANAARSAAAGAWTLSKLVAVGFGVLIALELLGKSQYTAPYRQRVQKRIRHHRQRAARAAYKYIAG